MLYRRTFQHAFDTNQLQVVFSCIINSLIEQPSRSQHGTFLFFSLPSYSLLVNLDEGPTIIILRNVKFSYHGLLLCHSSP